MSLLALSFKSLILSTPLSSLLVNSFSAFFSSVIVFSAMCTSLYFLSLCWSSHCVHIFICVQWAVSWLLLLILYQVDSVQFSSVAQSCPTLCDPMNRSTPGLPVHHQLPEFTQTHVHRVGDAIQPSHPLSSLSPPAPNPSQHQSLSQWVNSSHEVAKVLEFQL